MEAKNDEAPHEKTHVLAYVNSRVPDEPVYPQSDQSFTFHCINVQIICRRRVKALLRLHKCVGWSGFSLTYGLSPADCRM